MVQGAWCKEHGARSMVQGAWYKEHGTKSMVQGAWYKEHGTKSMVQGRRLQVAGYPPLPVGQVRIYGYEVVEVY